MTLFTIAEVAHHVADPECPACYEDYPEPCRCGGLVHATAGEDEDADGNPVLTTECDQCGRSEEELAEAR
jgi:hypothetical protein